MVLIGILLLVFLVISAVLLILLVLVQDEQGEGIGGFFGAGGTSSAFGSRTGNVLTRFTTVLAAVFLFCCLGLAYVNRSGEAGNVVGKAREQALSGNPTTQWWVETSPAPAPGTPEATPGAATATPAPATPAPASGGQ